MDRQIEQYCFTPIFCDPIKYDIFDKNEIVAGFHLQLFGKRREVVKANSRIDTDP